HFSHAYADGCSIYFTFAGHAPELGAAERLYDAIWRDGLEAATRVGGTISHHHGVGLLKAPYMIGEHREAMAIFEAAKAALDPDGIMNPGKMGLRENPGPRPQASGLRGTPAQLATELANAIGDEHVAEVPGERAVRATPGSAAE